MENLIIGYGEVGQAIGAILSGGVEHIDGEGERVSCQPDIVHICFPYSDTFMEQVEQYIQFFKPKCIVIHSTVPPGTCNTLYERISTAVRLIYSPVRGRHARNFVGDIRKYIKYYSSKSEEKLCQLFRDAFQSLTLSYVDKIETLEAAKILSTSYMLWCLTWEKEVYRLCKKHGWDYDFIYGEWNKSYNDNVYPEWKRPIYTHIEGSTKGHCLTLNTAFIDWDIHSMLDFMEYKRNEPELQKEYPIGTMFADRGKK